MTLSREDVAKGDAVSHQWGSDTCAHLQLMSEND